MVEGLLNREAPSAFPRARGTIPSPEPEVGYFSHEKCLAGLDELGLDDEARELFLGGNVARVFGL
ncbi:hypothetical protein ACMDCT_00010 [Halomonadaceae bacterium KBTZ08]